MDLKIINKDLNKGNLKVLKDTLGKMNPNKQEEENFLEMTETIKSEINEENVIAYIDKYLQSRNLKKEDLKKRKHFRHRDNLVQQLLKRSNLSKRKIAILIGVNRESVIKLSEEPSP